MKWKRKIQYMYIFSVSCWDAGRRIHLDCLKLHSRHRGSRAHLRVKRPPAQSVSRGPNKERDPAVTSLACCRRRRPGGET